MASMRKKNGKWTVFWTDGAGRRRSKVVSTRKHEAEAFLARKVAEKQRGLVGGYKAVPFADVAAEYIQMATIKNKPSTMENYTSMLRLRLLPAFGSTIAGEISRRRVDEYIAKRIKDGASAGGVRNEVALLSGVMGYAQRCEYSLGNPVQGATLPKVKKAEVCFLSADQARTLIEATPPNFQCLIATALLTGMRAGELAGLMLRDIDYDKHLIRVQRSARRKKLTTPKTDSSYRSIDIPPTLEKMLKEWSASPLRVQTTELVFSNSRGGILDMGEVKRRVLDPALERAGLPRMRFHDLRHTYASILIANGEPLKYIQAMMGHSSIQITADVYGHLLADVHSTAASRLEKSVFGPTSSSFESQ